MSAEWADLSVLRPNTMETLDEGKNSSTTAPPTYTTAPPIYTTAPPTYTTAPPTYTTAPPPDTTAPPTYTTAPPTYTTAPPTYTTAPPTYTTAPPPDHGTAPPTYTTATYTTAPPPDTTAPPTYTTAPPTYTTASPTYTTAPLLTLRLTLALESSRPAVDGDVRLNKTRSCCSGRVEIFYQGRWGSVCYSGWDVNDANVCAGSWALTGHRTDPIWLSSARCRGSERSITDCGTLGYYSCSLNAVAGVICQANQSDPGAEGDVRLVNGTASALDEWRSSTRDSGAPVGGPVWLTAVSCNGSELTLTDCGHSGNVSTSGTTDMTPVSVPPPDFKPGVEGEVRLIGVRYSYCSGQVEIFHQGQWAPCVVMAGI
ncbi:hypothetical protein WMY93_003213 [Mugilogobius chulae]|uniref:SRCR domain-containing protein n=1 Tax=Mugilogobius chulae TaxID=88201 RepID=A0AAW0PZA0_9GOBI